MFQEEEHKNRGGFPPPYVPTPEEIREKTFQIRWMNFQGFSEKFVGSVVRNGEPDFFHLRRMFAAGWSAQELEERYKPFL